MTIAPPLSEDDALVALQSLLPPGRAWPRDPSTVLTSLLRGMAVGWARVHARALNLLTDAFPASSYELLPEWEASLGLPDPCIGVEPLVSERQAQVVARFTNSGGQSVPYFIAYALQLGYVITITEFTPFRVGHVVGLPLYGEDWAHTWQVNTPADFGIHYFLVGLDTAGNPLASWGNVALLCELNRLKPGHTILLFVTVGSLDFSRELDGGLLPVIDA